MSGSSKPGSNSSKLTTAAKPPSGARPGCKAVAGSSKGAGSSKSTASKKVMDLERLEIIDLPAISRLEKTSFPADEAASSLRLEHRIMMANPYCYISFSSADRQVIGFVVATTAPEGTRRMTEDYTKDHYPRGNVLCIHSVVVEHQKRRKGLGTEMMRQYLKKVKETTNVRRVLLLAKRRLVPFYEKLGFQEIGESEIKRGKDKWIEMGRGL